MLDRGAAESPGRPLRPCRAAPSRDRRRALVACAVLALALHAAFIGNIGGLVPGAAGDLGRADVVADAARRGAGVEAPVEATP